MVHIGNDWDVLLKDEFQKEYYLRLRQFLAYEYRHAVVYPDMYDIFNALKYTPAGGTVRIYGDGETLVIADTGIGIREEDLPRIFEKGFTGYNGRAGQKSTGIGLYLCRRVTEKLNHDLTIVSRPGQGTIARLDLSREKRTME